MTTPAGAPPSICLACGQRGPVQAHHPARSIFVDDITGPDCPSCHQQLTVRQRDRGYFDATAVGATELDRARALVAGVGDQFALGLHRERAELLAASMERAAGTLSVLLDVVQPADRPARFLPDPVGARRRAKQVYAHKPARDSDPERIATVVWLTRNVLTTLSLLLGVPEHVAPERLTAIAEHPTGLLRGWAAVQTNEQLAFRLREVVSRAANRIAELFGWLLPVLFDPDGWEQTGDRPPPGPGLRAVTDLLLALVDVLAIPDDDPGVRATVAGWVTTAETLLPG